MPSNPTTRQTQPVRKARLWPGLTLALIIMLASPVTRDAIFGFLITVGWLTAGGLLAALFFLSGLPSRERR